jgi:hypothetical protein
MLVFLKIGCQQQVNGFALLVKLGSDKAGWLKMPL